MLKLIENEVIKMLFRRKLLLILGILLALILLFAYGENHLYKVNAKKYARTSITTQNYNWKPYVIGQLEDMKGKWRDQYYEEGTKAQVNIQMKQLQYYLDNNINPLAPRAFHFAVKFIEQAVYMFIPLLIIILAGDCVSGEFSSKTAKILLTRAVPRWKILLSKYIALLLMSTIVIFETALIAVLTSGLLFHQWGLTEPVATGFRAVSGNIDASNVVEVYQWQYLILVYALTWFVANVVGTISFMISVLVRNTSTSIGIMMAALISGGFLQLFINDWPLVKYFFATNINLPQYLTGSFHAVKGMDLTFSILILTTWAIGALFISFWTFIRQDVLV